jgi:hypothetical protein
MISAKRQPIEPSTAPAAPQVSGKLVIFGIVSVALAGAGISWWFRYNATHKAARFWGPETAALIRDAEVVTLFRKPSAETIRLARENPTRAIFDETVHDVSRSPGLLHLRNALLEDKNFIWPAQGEPWPAPLVDESLWVLTFYDPEVKAVSLVTFSGNCRQAIRETREMFAIQLTAVSTEPMAAGLREMFDEFSANAASKPAEQLR